MLSIKTGHYSTQVPRDRSHIMSSFSGHFRYHLPHVTNSNHCFDPPSELRHHIQSTPECHAHAILNIFQTVWTAYVNHPTTGLTFRLTFGFKYLFVCQKCGNKSHFHLTYHLCFCRNRTSFDSKSNNMHKEIGGEKEFSAHACTMRCYACVQTI